MIVFLLIVIIILMVSETARSLVKGVLWVIILVLIFGVWQFSTCNLDNIEVDKTDKDYDKAVQTTKEITGVDLSDTTTEIVKQKEVEPQSNIDSTNPYFDRANYSTPNQ